MRGIDPELMLVLLQSLKIFNLVSLGSPGHRQNPPRRKRLGLRPARFAAGWA
jgi:hypothetical protein